MAERPLPVFDVSGSAHEVSTRWQKWKRSFNYYADGEGLTNQKKKKSELLHLAGMEMPELLTPC